MIIMILFVNRLLVKQVVKRLMYTCAVTVSCNDGPLLIVSVYRSPKATYEDT